MTTSTLPTFPDEQLRDAYAFQVRQGYPGDMGRTAAAMALLEQDGGVADDEQIERLAAEIWRAVEAGADQVNLTACRECGCTDDDCSNCIERNGMPCHWVETDLCSACAK